MNVYQRANIRQALATVTGIEPTRTDIIPAQSGYAIGIVQIRIENNEANLTRLTLWRGESEYFHYNMGGSGTIIEDKPHQLELAIGSGFHGSLSQNNGSVTVGVDYILYDQRTPTNLNGATYVPKAIRKPNIRGAQ